MAVDYLAYQGTFYMYNHNHKPVLSRDKSIHVTDEVYNTAISSLGVVLSLFGAAFLINRSLAEPDIWPTIGFSIYSVGLIAMFSTSALHHGVNGSERVNHALRQLDYFAIFIMIAGSYTPFCLVYVRNSLGWSVFGVVWFLALGGIALEAAYPSISKHITLGIYLVMGWLIVLIAQPVLEVIPWQGVLALALGGFFFSVGGLIYIFEKPNPFPGKFGFHEIWHCFVLAGAGSHFYVMYYCF